MQHIIFGWLGGYRSKSAERSERVRQDNLFRTMGLQLLGICLVNGLPLYDHRCDSAIEKRSLYKHLIDAMDCDIVKKIELNALAAEVV